MSSKHNTISFLESEVLSHLSQRQELLAQSPRKLGVTSVDWLGPRQREGRGLAVPLNRHLSTQRRPAPHPCIMAEQHLAAFAQGIVKKCRVPGLTLYTSGMSQGTSILNTLSMVARARYTLGPLCLSPPGLPRSSGHSTSTH